MSTGQEGAPLNLSRDNDHYLLGHLERVEIQQLFIYSAIQTLKEICSYIVSGKYGPEKRVRLRVKEVKQREIYNIAKKIRPICYQFIALKRYNIFLLCVL